MGAVRRVVSFAGPGRRDIGRAGGRNVSPGEPIDRIGRAGTRVPPGFATTAEAYGELLDAHRPCPLVAARTGRLHGGARLDEAGAAVRPPFPRASAARPTARRRARRVRPARETGREAPEAAVSSSAIAEDLPAAGFAGQQETYLDVRGPDTLLEARDRRVGVRIGIERPRAVYAGTGPTRTVGNPDDGRNRS
ncbi:MULTISPECIES: PEP/pyruvate-binding domain-containing protein [unclassified Streptomyces]|uniref:PEP/pyruvate-binding domain-containing protein n=1 Tax=unclassified Streptomyces TaxID=2593676 RepID=UPI003318A546